MSPVDPVARTRQWVDEFVVRLGLCPFAAHPLRQGRVHFVACPASEVEACFYWAGSQVETFIQQAVDEVETTLLLFVKSELDDFEVLLDIVEELEQLLETSGADAYVQLAHFHPDYRFAGVPTDDPANATNRSPYPIVQLLRVASVTKAVAAHGHAEDIPRRNAALLRSQPSWALTALRKDG